MFYYRNLITTNQCGYSKLDIEKNCNSPNQKNPISLHQSPFCTNQSIGLPHPLLVPLISRNTPAILIANSNDEASENQSNKAQTSVMGLTVICINGSSSHLNQRPRLTTSPADTGAALRAGLKKPPTLSLSLILNLQLRRFHCDYSYRIQLAVPIGELIVTSTVSDWFSELEMKF